MQYKGLGKGLSALLKEEVIALENDLVRLVSIDKIETGDYQPRKIFDHDKIKELADSIASIGLLHPIIVTQVKEGRYSIIAGERRWRACKLVGLTEVPIIIKNLSNQEILRIALIENIQREELSVIEEAEGFARLIKEFNYTQDQLAQMLSKSRSHITNLLRLNQLPRSIKNKVSEGKLTMGHARCLIGHKDAEEIAEHIIQGELNVRRTENLVKCWDKQESGKNTNSRTTKNSVQGENKGSDLEFIATSLSEKLGLKVTIEDYSVGSRLILHYNNLEQLDLILSKLN